MDAATVKAVRLSGPAALAWAFAFARDPLIATRRLCRAHGPFVILARALPLARRLRAPLLGSPLVFTAGAAFNAEVLSEPEIWRGVSVLPGGPKNSAARRMTTGLPRLTGGRHAHYRKLISQPLRRTAVEASRADIARIVETELASWQAGDSIDLWESVRRVVQGLSVELLFGGADEQSRTIAALAGRMMELKWGPRAFALPINLPVTAYGRIVRESHDLERRLLRWIKDKRGRLDERDLASIIANTPDENGDAPDNSAIVAHVASLFALSSEGSQSAIVWTLILLAQHPRIAAALGEELHDKLGGTSPSLDKAGDLVYLDAVVKESMRILPPVPVQIRVAQRDTTIAGTPLPERTRVMLNTFLTNRSPDLYPEGDVFRPERWLTITPNAFEFPVFSAGPHLCPGFWFGTLSVKIALAAILTRFRVELPRDACIDYRTQPTLRPRQRLEVRLRPADSLNGPATPVSGKIRELVKFPG